MDTIKTEDYAEQEHQHDLTTPHPIDVPPNMHEPTPFPKARDKDCVFP